MLRTQVRVLLLATVLLLGARTAYAQSSQAAVNAATSWLALIDANNYTLAYDRSAYDYRLSISYADFSRAVTTFRQPLGSLVSRTLASATAQTTLDGAPDGNYYVIQFNTVLARKSACTETITMKYDYSLGTWAHYGYYVQ